MDPQRRQVQENDVEHPAPAGLTEEPRDADAQHHEAVEDQGEVHLRHPDIAQTRQDEVLHDEADDQRHQQVFVVPRIEPSVGRP